MKSAAMIAAAASALFLAGTVFADNAHDGAKTGAHHRTINGVVIAEKSGVLTVKTSDGATMPVTEKASHRHGHAVPKVGEEVTLILNENNNVIDVHLKGAEGAHSFVTGKLVYVGKMKPEIKLQTPDGDKTYPLVRQDIKTGGIEEGALVTAELNEAGAVIDLHRAKQ
ncbi:MAG TPA: hypothetical protein VL261_09340 [Nitrospira sp.]|jgi:hypothetical protein|nr:hypothetical protein [Nitrospira sp.]